MKGEDNPDFGGKPIGWQIGEPTSESGFLG
jgi:hypothetical protein